MRLLITWKCTLSRTIFFHTYGNISFVAELSSFSLSALPLSLSHSLYSFGMRMWCASFVYALRMKNCWIERSNINREKKKHRKKPLPNGLSQTLLITIINAHFLNNGLFKVIFFSLSTSVFCVPFIRFRIGINNLLWIDKVHNPWLIRVHFSECMCDYALRKKNQAEMRAFLSIFLRYSFV